MPPPIFIVKQGGTGKDTQTLNGVPYYDGSVINTNDDFTYDGTTVKIQNFNTELQAEMFTGSDIGAKINSAYAYAVSQGWKGVIIRLGSGVFSYSTPIVFGSNGVRVSLRGTPGGGTELDFTGGINTIACTINTGQQSVTVEHSKYVAIQGITFKGNATSTTNPQIGVYCGGSNGAAGAILDQCNIEGFGQGLVVGANTYMWEYRDGVIRNNGQNVHINTPSNSGEGILFVNAFIVDGAGNNPLDSFYVDNSGAVSITFIGGSFDDAQVHILQAVNISFYGTHFENPGFTAWGAYTWVLVDNNKATNVNMNGCIFFLDSTTASGKNPTNFISSGGTLTLDSCFVRTIVTSVVTNFAVITGSGVMKWSNFNRVGTTVITNMLSNIPFVENGWANSSGTYATITGGGIIKSGTPYVAKTATYSILASDEVVDCTSGTFNTTLPTAVNLTGKRFTIMNSGAGIITVDTTGGQTINGISTVTLDIQYAAVTVVSDGANWKIIA